MNSMTRSPRVLPIARSEIRTEGDVVAARQRARRIAELLGVERRDQTRIATAVAEIGVADRDQERIFEKFARIDTGSQRKVKGAGLGPQGNRLKLRVTFQLGSESVAIL